MSGRSGFGLILLSRTKLDMRTLSHTIQEEMLAISWGILEWLPFFVQKSFPKLINGNTESGFCTIFSVPSVSVLHCDKTKDVTCPLLLAIGACRAVWAPRQDLATPHLMRNCGKCILSLHCTLYVYVCVCLTCPGKFHIL